MERSIENIDDYANPPSPCVLCVQARNSNQTGVPAPVVGFFHTEVYQPTLPQNIDAQNIDAGITN